MLRASRLLRTLSSHFSTLSGTTTPKATMSTSTTSSSSSLSSLASKSLSFDNISIRTLPVEEETRNFTRPVYNSCFSKVAPTPLENPRVVAASESALELIGLKLDQVLSDPEFGELFAGNKLFEGSEPYSHCYCGYQFGYFAGQLGDGRAICLGEAIKGKERWEVQLKGSGLTPYSRHADGRAVLRSSIREFLCSEHMAAMGIPTTRAATLVVSDSKVARDPMYDGRVAMETCAVVSRLSPTLFRFGSWEIFVKSQDRIGPAIGQAKELAPKMLDHIIEYHFPTIFEKHNQNKEDMYVEFYQEVSTRTARMVAEWQLVGFTHGVMNTDNMSVLGVTIDYGPFGFLDKYNPKFVPNTTDEGGRYRYEAQPSVCKWNLRRFAEAISCVVSMEKLSKVLDSTYEIEFSKYYVEKISKKLGLIKGLKEDDRNIFKTFFDTLEETCGDFTNSFRCLSQIPYSKTPVVPEKVLNYLVLQSGTVKDAIKALAPPFSRKQLENLKQLKIQSPNTYMMIVGDDSVLEEAEKAINKAEELKSMTLEQKRVNDKRIWNEWLTSFVNRLAEDVQDLSEEEISKLNEERKKTMDLNNPKFILRNYMAQEAIKKAEKGDYSEVHDLLYVLTHPYDEHEDLIAQGKNYLGDIPPWAENFKLSCSS